MEYLEKKEYIREKVNLFIIDLNGFYSQYISDRFLLAYLTNSLLEMSTAHNKMPDGNMAYSSSIELFESTLEHGCGVISNGHHVAQRFAKYFGE